MFQQQPLQSQKYIHFVALIVFLGAVSGCSGKHTTPLKAIDTLAREKFEGEWYVIANIPYFAEKNKIATRTTYRKRGENKYDDIFTYKTGDFNSEDKTKVGSIKSMNAQNNQWQSTFYWFFKFKFDILYVNSDHSVMLLGHPSRNYGWVMSLTKTIDDQQYAHAMQIFADNGYDKLRFSKVPQIPAQLGLPGFQTTRATSEN